LTFVNNCDYVNASFVGEVGNVKFIAAQGPMNHTIHHFLQMMLDYNISLVIMLTPLVEVSNVQGKLKITIFCHFH